jgi:hypothetical protein
MDALTPGSSVKTDLSRQWRDIDPSTLAFEDISECLEIGVSSSDNRMA